MAFTEDLSQFFDPKDFGETAIISLPSGATRSIPVIYNTPTQEVAVYDGSVETDSPFVTCQSSDLTGVKNGLSITVAGKTWKIGKVSHDGTGVCTVYLK